MTTPENKQLMQNVFVAMAEGNSRPWVEAMAEDLSWTVIGRNPWSRTYHGKQAVLTELLAPLSASIEGRVKVIHSVLSLKVILWWWKRAEATLPKAASLTTTRIVS